MRSIRLQSRRRLQRGQAASRLAIALVLLLVLGFAGYLIWLAFSQPSR